MNTDSLSHQNKSPDKCLQMSDKEKKWKRNCLEACLQQRHNLSPFVISVDCLLGVESEYTLKRIASRPKMKLKHPYSRTCGYISSMLEIILFRAIRR